MKPVVVVALAVVGVAGIIVVGPRAITAHDPAARDITVTLPYEWRDGAVITVTGPQGEHSFVLADAVHARLVSLTGGECAVKYSRTLPSGLLQSVNDRTRRWPARTLPNGELACFIDEAPEGVQKTAP